MSTWQNELCRRWDQANAEGAILYRADTLTTRTLHHDGIELHLIHNACRDVYDRSSQPTAGPGRAQTTLADGSNPELIGTDDEAFRVIGNRFACMQYQCILAPTATVERLSLEFFTASLAFAAAQPELTLMYNALNAGKTVANQYWLLSFHRYEPLNVADDFYEQVGDYGGLTVTRRKIPCYILAFDFSNRVAMAARLLFQLAESLEFKNFNIFLHAGRAYFIPRRSIEIPTGCADHRFGGLEMIGYFVMKSVEALQTADARTLLGGMREIAFDAQEQADFEQRLRGINTGG